MTSARPVPEAEPGSLRFGELRLVLYWWEQAEAMADRKAELEKKRKKLDELRKARELKKAEAKDKEVDWPASNEIFNMHTTMFML